MAIFMRDPPNDPKSLYETKDHSSVKLSALGTALTGKGSKRQVRQVYNLPRQWMVVNTTYSL